MKANTSDTTIAVTGLFINVLAIMSCYTCLVFLYRVSLKC
jgi:hypothetical protein